MMIDIRRLTTADIPAADALRNAGGWNQTPADWERLLLLEPDGCFAAWQAGMLAGTATTTSYGTKLAWIGMVLVHPDHRRKGIARALMVTCLRHLRDCRVESIKLDATPLGQSLYTQFGFIEEGTLVRWECTIPTISTELHNVRAIMESDWEALIEMDARTIGARRSMLLHALHRSALHTSVIEYNGKIQGFGMLRPGAKASYLGPLVAINASSADHLVRSLLSRAAGAVFWDIPDPNPEAQSLAEKNGFHKVRPFTRMWLGQNASASQPQHLFGITDPATG
jgi:GNAT superfamily N-acetyltransferase